MSLRDVRSYGSVSRIVCRTAVISLSRQAEGPTVSHGAVLGELGQVLEERGTREVLGTELGGTKPAVVSTSNATAAATSGATCAAADTGSSISGSRGAAGAFARS